MKKMAILGRAVVSAAAFAVSIAAGTAFAQEVVQPLPSPHSERLSAALQRLARDSGDVNALLDAGEAALELRDIPAAIGFFGRAKDVSPSNSRVALGMARAYTLSRRPVEALRLFAEAERGGIAPVVMAKDRALAFDLVGDFASAQQYYRLALANGAGDDVQRNLALSQAISGDRAGFEATLVPLLNKSDLAAFRTRAFGLAILGDTEDAVDIAEKMMTPQVANRVAPYLRYMPRLTPAQQAAAGTLGVFPQTNAIGRDDAEIAAYSAPPARQVSVQPVANSASTVATNTPAMAASARLTPSGPPMGRPAQAAVQSTAQPSIASSLNNARRPDPVEAAPVAPPPPAQQLPPLSQPVQPQPLPSSAATLRNDPIVVSGQVQKDRRLDVVNASDPIARTILRGRAMTEADAMAISPVRNTPQQEVVQPARQPQANVVAASPVRPNPAPPPAAEAVQPELATIGATPSGLIGPRDELPVTAPASVSSPVSQPMSPPAPQIVMQSQAVVQSVPLAESQSSPAPVQPELSQSVSDAFAGFDLADSSTQPTPANGAVDITRIEIPREQAAPALPPPPPPPVHPARHWVQVATGKDLSALAFDWRRISGRSEGILDGRGRLRRPG